MSKLQYDSRFTASVDRLKAMGIKFYIEQAGEDEAWLVIDMPSVVKLIDSKITYPSRETMLDNNNMVIHFWRHGKPIGGEVKRIV